VVFIGQMGPILVIASGVWDTANFLEFVDDRAGKGELILCSTAILSGATYFIVKEYSSKEVLKADRSAKSLSVLFSVGLVLWGVVLASGLLVQGKFETDFQRVVHWVVYCSSLLMSFVLWFIEYSGQSAADAVREYADEAKGMIEKSRQSNAGGKRI